MMEIAPQRPPLPAWLVCRMPPARVRGFAPAWRSRGSDSGEHAGFAGSLSIELRNAPGRRVRTSVAIVVLRIGRGNLEWILTRIEIRCKCSRDTPIQVRYEFLPLWLHIGNNSHSACPRAQRADRRSPSLHRQLVMAYRFSSFDAAGAPAGRLDQPGKGGMDGDRGVLSGIRRDIRAVR